MKSQTRLLFWIRSLLMGGAVGVVLILASATWLTSRYGSLERWRLSRDGIVVVPDQSVKSFGQAPIRHAFSMPLVVSNLTDDPIDLMGYNTTCSCAMVDGLPTSIPPWGEVQLTLQIQTYGPGGPFHQDLEFYTNVVNQRTFRMTVVGEMIAE